MAKRPLKVFRTSIGFHDAYVATTSRKAALEAWGAGTDLFASGAAEQVTDAKLAKEPFERPGIVIRVARGTPAQHLAAAGKGLKRQAKVERTTTDAPDAPAKIKKAAPKPSRARLDKAEAALRREAQKHEAELSRIDFRIDALRRERDDVRSKRDRQMHKLEERRNRQEEAYREELDNWEP
jgi:hypothetical protein